MCMSYVFADLATSAYILSVGEQFVTLGFSTANTFPLSWLYLGMGGASSSTGISLVGSCLVGADCAVAMGAGIPCYNT